MLFDLRSRRRRHAVRVVYLLLALIMLAGLVLVGVGTGNNNGGLLNAFTNNGSSNSGNQVVDAATNSAIKAAKLHPDSAAAWQKLLSARWSEATTGSNYDTTTDTFTSGGTQELKLAAIAWNHYLPLIKQKPNIDSSLLAARVFQSLKQWTNASVAWQYVIDTPSAGSSYTTKGYECVAFNLYAAGQSTNAGLAATKALSMIPKSLKSQWKTNFKTAKGSATTAGEYAQQGC